MPAKIEVRFGDGQACSACDQPVLAAQALYQFELNGFMWRFHLGCLGLWTADLLKRGWVRGSRV